MERNLVCHYISVADPSLYLALGEMDKDEKAGRRMVMQGQGSGELAAANRLRNC